MERVIAELFEKTPLELDAIEDPWRQILASFFGTAGAHTTTMGEVLGRLCFSFSEMNAENAYRAAAILRQLGFERYVEGAGRAAKVVYVREGSPE